MSHNRCFQFSFLRKVLTGQCSPTSGDVFIYGRSISDQRAEFRKYLGYCPQYNTLYAKWVNILLSGILRVSKLSNINGFLFFPQDDSEGTSDFFRQPQRTNVSWRSWGRRWKVFLFLLFLTLFIKHQFIVMAFIHEFHAVGPYVLELLL